jgi:hypothetical protein
MHVGFDQDLAKPNLNILEQAQVVMPHRAAKMLAYALNAMIAHFESIHGTIPLNADRVAELDRQLAAQKIQQPPS